MKNKISPKIISLIFGVLVVCFAISFNVLGWTEPVSDPPAGNVSAPLNVSSTGQSKVGGLILNTGGAATGLVIEHGNVGIGTTSPTSKFQIGTGTVSQQWSGSSPYVYIQGVDNEVATPALLIQDENLNTMLNVTTTGDSSAGNVLIGGNVGIGTTSPSAKLDVAGNIVASGTICDSTGCIGEGGGSLWTENGANIYRSSGNVGIGDSTPSYPLEVAGDILNTGWIRTSGSSGLYFQSYGGGWYMSDSTWIRSYGSKSIYHNSGTMRTDGTFQVGSGGSTLNVPNGGNFAYRTNVLFANTAGNVGIGTTSPGSSKLKVEGGPIEAADGFILQTCTDGVNCPNDTGTPANGQMWLAE